MRNSKQRKGISLRRLTYYLFVRPFAIFLQAVGLADDAVDATRFRRSGWRETGLRLVRKVTRIPLMAAQVTFRTGRAAVIELLHVTGLLRDDVHAARLLRWSMVLRLALVLIATSTIGAGALWVGTRDPLDNIPGWISQSTQAAERGDFRTARIGFERLSQLEPDVLEWQYQWALADDGLGNVESCRERMAGVAPVESEGYLPAQVWLARTTLNQPTLSDVELDRVRLRLERVLQKQPEHAEASLLMAKIWMSAGQASQAAPYLERAAVDHPDLRLLVAEIRAMQNDRDGKKHEAQAARDELEKQLLQSPRDTKLRLQLARAYLLVEDFPKSMEVLREGLHGDDVKVVSVFLSEGLTAWSYQLSVDNGSGERRLELLTEALKHDPRNGAAIVQMLELGEQFPPLNAAVERELQNLHPDDLPPLALVALGNAAWRRGTPAVARARFEQAYLLDPSNPGSANNLAWALSHSPPLELERARRLCDDALRVAPLQKNLLDTRSDILLQLHAWQDAQADLSALARLYPEMPGVREKLEHLKSQLRGTTNEVSR